MPRCALAILCHNLGSARASSARSPWAPLLLSLSVHLGFRHSQLAGPGGSAKTSAVSQKSRRREGNAMGFCKLRASAAGQPVAEEVRAAALLPEPWKQTCSAPSAKVAPARSESHRTARTTTLRSSKINPKQNKTKKPAKNNLPPV